MRFDEFKKPLKKDEPVSEILPALGAIAGAAARGAVGSAVRGAASMAAKKIGSNLAKKTGSTAKKSTGAVNIDPRDKNSDPNDTIGTQDQEPQTTTTRTRGTQGSTPTNPPSSASQIKTGKNIKLPSQTTAGKPGPTKNFRVNKVIKGRDGEEVEILNPKPKAGEPRKFVFKKDDLERMMPDEDK